MISHKAGQPFFRRAIYSASLAFAFLICLLAFSGCHGSRGSAAFELPRDFDQTKKLEITFWAKNDTNKAQVDIYKKAISDFESFYPNIVVTLRLYTDYRKIYNDVITNLATNTAPNVCVTYPDHIATYLTGPDTVVPLDSLFTDRKYGLGGSEVRFDSPKPQEIIPQFLSECVLNGKHYAIPFMRSTEACYVNKTYVQALGYALPDTLSWDFVWEVSEAAMAKADEDTFIINGQKVMIPFIYKSTDNMMIQMLRQKGAGYSTNAGEITIFNDATKELLYAIAGHVKNGAFSTFKISSYPANFLNAGQCIFAIDSTAGATWMGSKAPLLDISEDKLIDFETVVMTIPQFDENNPKMISQGPSICVFNKDDPQEVLASWLFAQYLLTDSVQIAYSQTEGYVPVTSKARESAAYKDYLSRRGEDNEFYYDIKIAASELLLNNIHNTFVTPVFNGSASLRDAAGQLIENVTKSVRRKETVDEAYMEKLFNDVRALYRLPTGSAASGGGAVPGSGAAPGGGTVPGSGAASGLNAPSAPGASGRADLGPLPKTAKILLSSLALAWVLMGLYSLVPRITRRYR